MPFVAYGDPMPGPLLQIPQGGWPKIRNTMATN